MDLSLFLAKFFGIYFLIMGSLWALRRDVFLVAIDEFFASRSMMFFSGVAALSVGIAMAIAHSVWEPNWRGLISAIGYLSLIKGVARIGFPEMPRKAGAALASGQTSYMWAGLCILLGTYLTWAGFSSG